MRNLMMFGSVFTCLAAFGYAAQALPPSTESGADLAARWCADCHMPALGKPDAGPSFAAISAGRSTEQIIKFLSQPHARPMGGIALNAQEARDVASYIKAAKR